MSSRQRNRKQYVRKQSLQTKIQFRLFYQYNQQLNFFISVFIYKYIYVEGVTRGGAWEVGRNKEGRVHEKRRE